MSDDQRTYPDGEHPLDALMAVFERLGTEGAVWHDYGEGNAHFHGIEFRETMIKVSGEAHSIHDRWWSASYRPMVILDPDEVLADPEGTARRLAEELGR